MNRIFLSGNLTRNPETRFMSDGTAVSNFGLAVNERWSDRETGEPRETVCFVEIEAWGRQAELIHEYFKKGTGIMIEGSLKFDSWKADDGTNRNRLKVRLQRFEFMGPRNGTPNSSDNDSETETETAASEPTPTPTPTGAQPQASSDENPPF